ncbi:regulator [Pedobacter sp. PACM 27299]|uniref:histidine kinase n=1 Tax=Pedobacter sp. PACM 27299 TaxID=1727164 RepID=UPI000706DE13|nr:histidine kinase [Pedobacter sp. PACM 27299]ALL05981.1 regulator [Pedobacter sp. PACM 27299]
MNRLVLLTLLLLSFSSCKTAEEAGITDPVYQVGDDQEWAFPTHDDHKWSKNRTAVQDRIYWVRAHVELLKGLGTDGHLGLKVNAFGAFEVYWDGQRIGQNGILQQLGQKEVPGTETSCFMIPDALAGKGKHLLAIRASQAYLSDDLRDVILSVGNYDQLIKRPIIIASFMNITAGVFLIAAVYYFFIFINSRKKDKAVLIFCITCFIFFILQVTEYIKVYITIPYDHFYLRLKMIGFLTFVIALLIPLYFSIQFQFKRKGLVLGILGLSLLLIFNHNYGHYDLTSWYFGCAMWFAALLIVGNAMLQKEKGAGIVMTGLLASALIDYFLYYDFSLYISFNIIILCMLYLHTIRSRDAELEYQSALLLSARLQTELLKKNIQPHFIKNTLTSLIDWIEESPKQGVVFIQALSAEFDLLNEMAEETLIPIQKEIELCKVHLKVMQFRKELKYYWSDSGVEASELIPPAILHTLLENGITHSKPLADGSIRFHLSFIRYPEFKQYTLLTMAENREMKYGKERGTGFKYIKARLRESYGAHWTFTSEASPEGWMTTIKINK